MKKNPEVDSDVIDQKREYFRLEYPYEFRPRLLHEGKQYQVVNISEFGVKFRAPNSRGFVIGQQLEVDILFHDKEQFTCSGEVIRLEQAGIVLHLDVPVPLHKIRSEHLILINQFLKK